MVKKYRKKPLVVTAVQWTGDNVTEVMEQFGGRKAGFILVRHLRAIQIPTKEGIMEASQTDYIIRGIKGEYYPCKADIFKKTYEPVT